MGAARANEKQSDTVAMIRITVEVAGMRIVGRERQRVGARRVQRKKGREEGDEKSHHSRVERRGLLKDLLVRGGSNCRRGRYKALPKRIRFLKQKLPLRLPRSLSIAL